MDFGGLAASALSGGMGNAIQLYSAYTNYKQQRRLLNYQKDLQNTIFAREDDSVQRRVADLKAAGLSPVLAAGSGAGAGSVVATSAPRLEGLDQLDKGISGALATKQLELTNLTIDKTAEEKALIKKQQLKTDADAAAAAASARKADADTAYTAQKTYQQLMDNKIQEATGLPSNPSTPAKVLRDLFGTGVNLFNQPQKQDERSNTVGKSFNVFDPTTWGN